MLKIAAAALTVLGFAVIREWIYLSFALWVIAALLLVKEGVIDIVYVAAVLIVAAVLYFIAIPLWF